ncbi:ATP-dependent DNA helicase PIF2-like, partial [Myzus persicae]|uniref:ATP-dependent DNA helicase PIF2-like n=1 Tax=Myzus persicae TaxID=13164 RepID=UPI000B930B5B
MNGKQLQYYNLPLPECDSNDSNVNMDNQFEYMRETQYDKCSLRTDISTNEPRLTNEQRCVFDTVYNSVLRHDGKLFFIDAPGGTGKTFLLKLLLSKIRQEEKISLCVASSGIAATLLPGGRTAHSMFKLPLTIINNDLPVCNIKKGSEMAKLIQECKLIVWDECTMAHKKAIEALNRSLIDLTGKNDIMGRITIVFSGDFRQILPVVPRGTKTDEIRACIKSSILWEHVIRLKLTSNIRVQLSKEQDSDEFSKFLLDIGEGKLPIDENEQISLTNDFGKIIFNIPDLISSIYPDLTNVTL